MTIALAVTAIDQARAELEQAQAKLADALDVVDDLSYTNLGLARALRAAEGDAAAARWLLAEVTGERDELRRANAELTTRLDTAQAMAVRP